MYEDLGISKKVIDLAQEVEEEIQPIFKELEQNYLDLKEWVDNLEILN